MDMDGLLVACHAVLTQRQPFQSQRVAPFLLSALPQLLQTVAVLGNPLENHTAES
jgi:hypothetical protein